MVAENKKPVVISLGGSLMVPEDIATDFLAYFRDIIEAQVDKGRRFAIVVGGGKVARRYQDALRSIRSDVTDEDLDWIGIAATRLNAQFLHHLLKDVAAFDIITDPHDVEVPDEPVLIGAGWKPGWSTDYVAVRIAEALEAQTVINLSNIDAVYTEDPKKNPNAEKLDTLTWNAYQKLIPKKWSPGMSTPFDPVASQHASDLGLTVVVMGSDLSNLEQYFAGEKFAGTVIS